MTTCRYRSAQPRGIEANRVDELAEFAVLVALSPLGTPAALESQRLGRELCERHDALDAEIPVIEADRLFAVARHLHALGLHGFAELTYRAAATRDSTPPQPTGEPAQPRRPHRGGNTHSMEAVR
jgi:hypothetical protein